LVHVSAGPPCHPGRWACPRPVLTVASLWSPAQRAPSCRADAQTPGRSGVGCPGRSMVPRPSLAGSSWSGHVPRAPGPGGPGPVMRSRPMAASLPPPASLLRAHAAVLHPPRASVLPTPPGLCRWRSAPAGRRTCPPVSLRLRPGGRGPRPRPRVECLGPLRPPRQRPAPRAAQGGAAHSPCRDGRPAPCARLQSWRAGQARRGARHPERSSRDGIPCRAAVTLPSEPLLGCDLPRPRLCSPSASGH
jgi:hypothetical protein